MACPANSVRRAFLEGVARAAGAELGALALDPKRRDAALARCRAFFAEIVDGEKRQHCGTISDPAPDPSPTETPSKTRE